MNTTGSGIYQKDIIIDGEEYKLHALSPSQALKIAAKLTKIIGEPLARMSAADGKEDRVSEVLPMAVKALTERLDEDQIVSIIEQLLKCVSHSGKPITLNDHFQARLGRLIQLVGEILTYQFSDFFSAIGQAVAKVGERNQKV